ncbi:PREDICTED: Duffy antigen/chemokine receptor [Elephantulus edwardii]|uniref:Duffy antigen/chemokine receptor n=1 Tax=Elephantulus edwardii TaxID=28737 RepID=UPI0003F0BF65|nr:PREDICTED: Duffy antigen/chemokine receptor [Elephantulus edwardii]
MPPGTARPPQHVLPAMTMGVRNRGSCNSAGLPTPSVQVNTVFSTDKNSSTVILEEFYWNDSYESYDYDDSSLEAAAPCHSCSLLDDSSLPFFIVASVLGFLAGGAVLFALLRPLFHWELCPDRPILVELAVGSALFSMVMPMLAPGLSSSLSTVMCSLGHLVWYSLAFAQALLIACRACLGPKLGTCRVPGFTLGLTMGLWGMAALLALPTALTSGNSQGYCALNVNRGLGTLQYMHVTVCFIIFFLLPTGLVGAKGLKRALGGGPGPWVDILWVWFIFWWPHGVVMGFDSLVRARVLLLPTCLAQKVLDLLLHLAEALAILHCVATPLILALFCHKTTHTSLSSLTLPERRSSLDILGGKS